MLVDKDEIGSGIARLRQKGMAFDEGLSNAEISAIEGQFQFVFPPDLRLFLHLASPVSPYFVNWRGEVGELRSWLNRPIEGILFDVQNKGFWHSTWGSRPVETSEAIMTAQRNLLAAPKLIPIGDRIFTKCIPAIPNEGGNPVFSIHQTDILHAGRNLGNFLNATRKKALHRRHSIAMTTAASNSGQT
jgi:hypothetical protein